MIETELCAYTLEACEAARRAGVTRVELCASPWEGGVTPSAGAIRLARRIEGLQLSVMIRPRGGDFRYTDREFGQLLEEVRFARESGADCIAVGVLTADGRVDAERMAEVMKCAEGMEVTFHRAFDGTRDGPEALETLVGLGCRRVLTSGGRATAEEGIEALRALVGQTAGRIAVMAGCGVNPSNARLLAATGVDALHFSARRLRESGMTYRNPHVALSGVPGIPEYASVCADEAVIRQILFQIER